MTLTITKWEYRRILAALRLAADWDATSADYLSNYDKKGAARLMQLSKEFLQLRSKLMEIERYGQ